MHQRNVCFTTKVSVRKFNYKPLEWLWLVRKQAESQQTANQNSSTLANLSKRRSKMLWKFNHEQHSSRLVQTTNALSPKCTSELESIIDRSIHQWTAGLNTLTNCRTNGFEKWISIQLSWMGFKILKCDVSLRTLFVWLRGRHPNRCEKKTRKSKAF